MGHQRLGSLPASHNLPEIVRLLLAGETSGEVLAAAITKACDGTLQRALKDPAFVEVRNPSHRGHRFRRNAGSIPTIAGSPVKG